MCCSLLEGSMNMYKGLGLNEGCWLQRSENETIITGAGFSVLLVEEVLSVSTCPSWHVLGCTPQCPQPSYTGHLYKKNTKKYSFKQGCNNFPADDQKWSI